MADEHPHQRLIDQTRHTRFGAGNDPSAAGKRSRELHPNPSSIRAAIKHMISLGYPKELDKHGVAELVGKMLGKGEPATFAEMVAFAKIRNAVNGDTKAQQQLEETTDGKLPNTNIKADVSLADLLAQVEQQEAEDAQRTSLH